MKNIVTFEEFINESVKTEKWAVFFYDDHKDIFYTLYSIGILEWKR
jgi:hypothetical protein